MTTDLFTDILGSSTLKPRLNSAIVEGIKAAPVNKHPLRQNDSSSLKADFIKAKLKTQSFYKKPTTISTKPTKYKSIEAPKTDLQQKLEKVSKSTLSIINHLNDKPNQTFKQKQTLNSANFENSTECLERASYKKSKYMKRTGRMLNKISAAEKIKYKESSMLNNKKKKEKVRMKHFIKNKESEDDIKSKEIDKDRLNDIFEDNIVETNILKNNKSTKDFSLFSLNENNEENNLVDEYNKDIIDESESEEEKEVKHVNIKPLGWGNWYSVDEAKKEYRDKKYKNKNGNKNEKEPFILFLNQKNKQSNKYKPK